MKVRVYDKINNTYYISEVYGYLNFGGGWYIVGRQEQNGNGTYVKAMGMRWRVKKHE